MGSLSVLGQSARELGRSYLCCAGVTWHKQSCSASSCSLLASYIQHHCASLFCVYHIFWPVQVFNPSVHKLCAMQCQALQTLLVRVKPGLSCRCGLPLFTRLESSRYFIAPWLCGDNKKSSNLIRGRLQCPTRRRTQCPTRRR